MNISRETIQSLKDFVFKLDYEICGNLRNKNSTSNEIILYHMKKGDKTVEQTVEVICTHIDWNV